MKLSERILDLEWSCQKSESLKFFSIYVPDSGHIMSCKWEDQSNFYQKTYCEIAELYLVEEQWMMIQILPGKI